MTTLNFAHQICLGSLKASAVYAGSIKVWSPFKPTDFAGCAIWIDASKLSLANGAAVTSWTNLGTAPSPAIIGSPSPTFRTNALNTVMPVVRVAGGQGRFRFSSLAIDRNYTLIFVVRKWSLRAGRVIAAHIGGTNAPNILWGFWSDRFDCAYVEGWMVPDVVVTATTAWKLYTGDSSATGTARLYSNGQLLRSHPTPPPSKGLSSTLNISGHDDTSTEDADCEVAELVLYNRVLPEPERMVVEDYMRVKWNPL